MLTAGFRVGVLLAIAAAILSPAAPATASDEITLGLESTEPAQDTRGTLPETVVVPARPGVTAPKPVIEGLSGILMDASSGQILYSKNEHLRLPNASTTKIMTAILLIENCGMSEMITASKKAAETPYTSIHLQPGEKISAKDALYALMVRSANDAAVAIAEHIGGSTAGFAAMMNRKAKEIGCRNTNFVTPNGLHHANHYSSAYDLVTMARYALRYPDFVKAAATRKYTLSSRTKNRKDLVVFASHQYLKKYPYADGIKSGYIKQARYCYVGSATRGGWKLLSAVLKSEHSADDTIALMNYGFANYAPFTLAKAGQLVAMADVTRGRRRQVGAAPSSALQVVVPRSGARVETRVELRRVQAPVARGAAVGSAAVLVDGFRVADFDLVAAEAVGFSSISVAWGWLRSWGIVVACLALGGRYGYGAAIAKNTRRRRRRVASALRDFDRFR